MEEIWKVVRAHPRFEISNLGNLKCDGVLRRPYPMKKGYLISKIDGKRNFIHRLVASEFVDNPSPETFNQVNHINGIKSDNRALNLEWCDNRMNVQHAVKIGLHKAMIGDTNGAAKISNEKAMAILRIMSTSSFTNRQAARYFGIGYGTIRDIRNGKNWRMLDGYRNYFAE